MKTVAPSIMNPAAGDRALGLHVFAQARLDDRTGFLPH
ncbi:hypothetical protein L284_22505 [Novosphingobium lindaniclasticum LE124]|uniref:Uncharacterized protein n=1 Tax=Novosphingobium lindaniclasticum LE124 TaxID=1096930 RepID=T0H675_9SPHN|nr:hypothetical protein L284_22505 [Novosphingobium lindaniclasticum LE124]